LEEENRKLKQMVADLSLDKHMLQEVLSKKVLRPAGRRALVRYPEDSFRVSERRACAVVCIRRSTQRYRSIAPVQTALRMRI
jgi:putative transposase